MIGHETRKPLMTCSLYAFVIFLSLRKSVVFITVLFLGYSFAPIGHSSVWGGASAVADDIPLSSAKAFSVPHPCNNALDGEWGGHVKLRGSVSWVDNDSLYKPVGTGRYYDGHTEVRLKTKLFFGAQGYCEAHYEAILFGGDTRRKGYSLARCFPALVGRCISLMPSLEDDRRLMDLTTTLDRDQGSLLYHRLDRLSLTLQPHWGVIRIGRQAVTWGNGLIFNPMDLFNPFSPTDIERDYKIGDDLVSVQVPLRRKGDLQLLYVPRRSVETHRVQWDHSSLAAKLHFSRGMTEFDVMASKHYEDAVVGIEGAGYFKQAAWRLDAILTIMDRHSDSEGYIVLVANIDYSWMWKEKNWYGFLEVYFNGLSHDRYTDGLTNPDIFERLARGELFTLGRIYLSAHVMSELHPLFSAYLTVISNLADPSAVLQPHAIWDIIENVQVTVGGNISLGEQGTEFGGFTIPGSRLLLKPTDSAFVWVSYYF